MHSPEPDNNLPSLAEILLARSAYQASQMFDDPALGQRAKQLERQNRVKANQLLADNPMKPPSAPSSIKN